MYRYALNDHSTMAIDLDIHSAPQKYACLSFPSWNAKNKDIKMSLNYCSVASPSFSPQQSRIPSYSFNPM